MKAVYRLFWCGLTVFLLSFIVGIFNLSSSADDNLWSAIGLTGMLCGAALFALCAVVIENDNGEENQAMHAARCWHCARALNSDVSLALERAKAAETIAHTKTDKLMLLALEQSLAVHAELSEQELHELAAGYPRMLVDNKNEQEHVTAILRELSSCARECAHLLAVSQQVVAITGPTFAATGRWRTGRPVAGQYMLANDVEPQQITVVLARALAITGNQIASAYRELCESQELGRRHFDALSRFLTTVEP
ncbi:hypothetical protein BH11CYA1_BH11CYA1_38500 [soil metagenome]